MNTSDTNNDPSVTNDMPDLSGLLESPAPKPVQSENFDAVPDSSNKHTPNKKPFIPKKILIAIVLFFIVSLPVLGVIVYNVAKPQQLADTRGKAACISCPGGSCPDGWTYGPDSCAPQSSCSQRASEACSGHQGGGTQPTSPPNNPTSAPSNVCAAGSADGCTGVAFGGQISVQPGNVCMICVKQANNVCGRQFCDPNANACTGSCKTSSCNSLGLNAATGICATGQYCCSSTVIPNVTNTPKPPNTSTPVPAGTCPGLCIIMNQGQTCANAGRASVSGTCSTAGVGTGQVNNCCTVSTVPEPTATLPPVSICNSQSTDGCSGKSTAGAGTNTACTKNGQAGSCMPNSTPAGSCFCQVATTTVAPGDTCTPSGGKCSPVTSCSVIGQTSHTGTCPNVVNGITSSPQVCCTAPPPTSTPIPANSCKPSGNTAAACNGLVNGQQTGTCICTLSGSSANDCKCSTIATPIPTKPAGTSGTPGAGTCVVDNPSTVNSYISLSAGCTGSYTLEHFETSVSNGTTSSQCVGISGGRTTSTVSGPGMFTPAASSCGKCVQIDVNVNGTQYGTASYSGDCSTTNTPAPTATPVPQCGSSCTASTQCGANQSCSGGVCKLTSCVNNPSSCAANGCSVLPTNTATLPPSATPAVGQCLNIIAYKNGVQVNPTTLRAGDQVVFGINSTPGIVRARIRINGQGFNNETDNWTLITAKVGSEFRSSPYTLPTGTLHFVVEGQIEAGTNNWL